jgi:hypothetical protein
VHAERVRATAVSADMRRAKITPPRTQGVPRSWLPQADSEHFMQCPTCGHLVDCYDLNEVAEHNDEYHLAPLKC